MSIVNNTVSVISGLNEFVNLFQWVIPAISSLKSKWNGTQKEKLQGDVQQLQKNLKGLSDTLPAMYSLIDRAEWMIHKHDVADLLPKLKDAVYDAEDLLDEFKWYDHKLSVEGNAISVEPVIAFTQGSFSKVADIQERLNNLSGKLKENGPLPEINKFDESARPETSSFGTKEKIFGRDKEEKKLISLLGVSTDPSRGKRKRSGEGSSGSSQVCATVDSNEVTRNSVPEVLPIVGIGGVGKTTLAQVICKNSKVECHFDLIIWICVSDDFDVKRLTKEAIVQFDGKVTESDNLNFLQRTLANSLKTKRFLIVLDDMWDENKQHWDHFYAPFKNVVQGSMMLVTTRSPKVAGVVRTKSMDSFPLEGLNEDDFRKFFKQCVFGSNSANNDPKLEQIGEKILPKLRGSPLAAKTIGRLLNRHLAHPAYWDMILNSQLWEIPEQQQTDILPALRLSYMYLPFHLKRCFAFCAVYPKDYNFKKEDLAEIWAAEGLVEYQHTGGQYFEELAHLSFFQKYPRTRDKYVIHDLMHDMAQLVSKDECFVIKETKDLPKIPQNVRHLLVLKGGDIKCSDLLNLCKHRKLRTLLCDLSLKSKTGNTALEKWCTELLRMRVMVCSSISKWGLPDNISNMKHLRYLKILDSCLCKRLPEAFCCLYNMQVLYAKKWEIDDIPSGVFGMLIKLQKFESANCQFLLKPATDEGHISKFEIKKYNGESLRSWLQPQNSEHIHSYNSSNSIFKFLTDVVINYCQNLSSLEQFLQPAYMPIIKKINISDCESLESVPTERFGDLDFLEVLRVFYCRKIKSRCLFAPSLKELYLDDSGNLGSNIECSSLTILHLSSYPLESIELQSWNLPLLQELKITYCTSLTIIRDTEPISTDLPLGGARSRMEKFPSSLTRLTIEYCPKLETIDDLLCLPFIEKIYILRCDLLSLQANRLGSFRLLKDLDVSWCPNLNWQSGTLLPPSLKKLMLWRCGDFSACFPSCLENLASLESLEIEYCECIVSVPGHLWSSNLKSLKRLEFYGCPKLKSIGGPGAVAHISYLRIDKCPELKEFEQPMMRGSIF